MLGNDDGQFTRAGGQGQGCETAGRLRGQLTHQVGNCLKQGRYTC